MFKKIVVILVFFLIFVGLTGSAKAQSGGIYFCQWDSMLGFCNRENRCEGSYKPGYQCSGLSASQCETGEIHDCIPESSCGGRGGPCCQGSFCDRPDLYVCSGGTCEDCGMTGSICCSWGCFGSSRCEGGICVRERGGGDGGDEYQTVTGVTLDYSQVFCETGGIKTAFGCIPVDDTNALASTLLKIGLGIGGGVTLVMIVIAGYITMTSRGDPKRLQAGKDLLFAALSGLILLIFSVFILRIVGVDILGLFP